MALIWIGVGFAAFGMLVGTTAGLSSAELTTTLLGLLFALIGGSIGVLLGKLDEDGRKVTGAALVSFSIFATAGIYTGIYVRINDLLRTTPRTTAAASESQAASAASAYLKSGSLPLVAHLVREVSSERMTLPEACAVLQDQHGARTRK